jgi:flavin-dependent dehydrogenase
MAADPYDVVVVGARCAGAPLAALLARTGARVALVERASFPSDTISSHLFEADALAFLDRLGVSEALRATGAPLVNRTNTRVEDVSLNIELPRRPGDVGAVASVRRHLLDPILAGAAEEAGADLHTATEVIGLLRDRARVAGVRVAARGADARDVGARDVGVGDASVDEAGVRDAGVRDAGGSSGRRGGEAELRARLVVGADGRHSTVAKLCGSRRYNLTPNRRLLYWAFFEGADFGPEPTFLSHRWGDRFILSIPSDSGLHQVLIWPEKAERERFGADIDAAFLEHARLCEPVADALAGARQVGKVLGAVSWEGFFRDAAGPGWILSGDAGHFKSPGPGRGIGDAFIQAESLAATIAEALGGGDDTLDAAMRRWGRWRDREFAQHYWLAYDLEEEGSVPAVLVEILRDLRAQGRAGLFFDLLNHRARPTQVLTPPRALRAAARLLGPGRSGRGALLRELGALGARDAGRRWRNRRPLYAAG